MMNLLGKYNTVLIYRQEVMLAIRKVLRAGNNKEIAVNQLR